MPGTAESGGGARSASTGNAMSRSFPPKGERQVGLMRMGDGTSESEACSLSVPNVRRSLRLPVARPVRRRRARPGGAPDVREMRARGRVQQPCFVVAFPSQGVGRYVRGGAAAVPLPDVPAPARGEGARPQIRAGRLGADRFEPADAVGAGLEKGDEAAAVKGAAFALPAHCAKGAPSKAAAGDHPIEAMGADPTQHPGDAAPLPFRRELDEAVREPHQSTTLMGLLRSPGPDPGHLDR